jgi:TRAP-type C4-dicarboxylate transport system substrate-binding protein
MRTKLSLTFVIVVLVSVFLFITRAETTAASKVINLKFNNYFPPLSEQSKLSEKFIQEIEKRTDGRVKITYYPGGSLLSGPATADGVTKGVVDIGYISLVFTMGRYPLIEACSLPLSYPSAWVGSHVVNDFYRRYKPKEFDKLHTLFFNSCGPSVLFSKKAVYKLEDLEGVKARAIGRAGVIFKNLGGSPAAVPTGEVYDAMVKGVLDGGYYPLEAGMTWKIANGARSVTLCWPVGDVYTFCLGMNKNSWNKLPQDIQKIFDEVSEAYEEKFALMWNRIDIEGQKYASQRGLELIDLSPEEAKRWKSVTQPVIDSYIRETKKKGFSENELEEYIEFLQERVGYWTKKQIERGIKSATGPKEMRAK